MQNEVAHFRNELGDLPQVDSLEWRYEVVAILPDGSFGIELAHRGLSNRLASIDFHRNWEFGTTPRRLATLTAMMELPKDTCVKLTRSDCDSRWYVQNFISMMNNHDNLSLFLNPLLHRAVRTSDMVGVNKLTISMFIMWYNRKFV